MHSKPYLLVSEPHAASASTREPPLKLDGVFDCFEGEARVQRHDCVRRERPLGVQREGSGAKRKGGSKPSLTCDFVVRPLGFEPRTCGLRVRCSEC